MFKWLIIICLIFGLTPGLVAAQQSRILVVHSYHAGYEWTDAIQRGILRALTGDRYVVNTLYMDTKRHTDEAWKIQAGRNAMQMVETFKPDVVITADDNAQAYFAKELSKRNDSPRIVFCGVNAEPQDYGFPNRNATGFLGRAHLTGTLRLAHALKPAIQRVVLLSDDSLTSKNAYEYYRTLNIPMKIVSYEMVSNFSQWQDAVHKANDNADALLVTMYHTLKQNPQDTTSMQPSSVMQWTLLHCRIPILGVYCPVEKLIGQTISKT